MKIGLNGPIAASFLVTLVVLSGILYTSRPAQDWLFSRHFKKEAFGKTRWGMSTAQVEAVSGGVKLEPSDDANRYYAPTPGLENRYRVFIQRDVPFLESQAAVHYVFFDDKLYAYHVTLKGRDSEALDRQVRSYLVQRFGDVYSDIADGSSLRAIWHLRDVIVNFWIVPKPLSLSKTYEAVFGVVSQPLERTIPTS